eukprot:scaffold6029_cov277-Pinguiococcus_pyrenoidosus.AAC.5
MPLNVSELYSIRLRPRERLRTLEKLGLVRGGGRVYPRHRAAVPVQPKLQVGRNVGQEGLGDHGGLVRGSRWLLLVQHGRWQVVTSASSSKGSKGTLSRALAYPIHGGRTEVVCADARLGSCAAGMSYATLLAMGRSVLHSGLAGRVKVEKLVQVGRDHQPEGGRRELRPRKRNGADIVQREVEQLHGPGEHALREGAGHLQRVDGQHPGHHDAEVRRDEVHGGRNFKSPVERRQDVQVYVGATVDIDLACVVLITLRADGKVDAPGRVDLLPLTGHVQRGDAQQLQLAHEFVAPCWAVQKQDPVDERDGQKTGLALQLQFAAHFENPVHQNEALIAAHAAQVHLARRSALTAVQGAQLLLAVHLDLTHAGRREAGIQALRRGKRPFAQRSGRTSGAGEAEPAPERLCRHAVRLCYCVIRSSGEEARGGAEAFGNFWPPKNNCT